MTKPRNSSSRLGGVGAFFKNEMRVLKTTCGSLDGRLLDNGDSESDQKGLTRGPV